MCLKTVFTVLILFNPDNNGDKPTLPSHKLKGYWVASISDPNDIKKFTFNAAVVYC